MQMSTALSSDVCVSD
uniref:Uncharacterized protein n=1 Tax=Anguilla anguilla TaxID=7936 RepID=A0A0E9W4C9_ANGAN